MRPDVLSRLPSPARYEPWLGRGYDVSPRLRPLGSDFGNGVADGKVFQFDTEFEQFAAEKAACRAEELTKYRVREGLTTEAERVLGATIQLRLACEWPELFSLEAERLSCHLTGNVVGQSLDELAAEMQEDFAVVAVDGDTDRAVYFNVCLPSHWDPREKVGRSFFNIHTVVPGFEKINANAESMVQAMLNRGPFVRFVWGVQSDSRLNHHPVAPAGIEAAVWAGQNYTEAIFVRTERQVILGFPEVGLILFTIRVGLVPLELLSMDSQREIFQAVEGMSAPARAYKGINETWETALNL